MNIVIPMAGRGQRFSDDGFKTDKPLIDINGTPMIIKAMKSLDMPGKLNFIIRETIDSSELITLLEQHFPNCWIEIIENVTEGPACTCYKLKKIIDNNKELIIANCDQIMWWDGEAALHALRYIGYDGVLVTYTSESTKNSFAKLDRNGNVIDVREKEVISNISLNGIHYWRKGKFFIKSYEQMLQCNDRAPNGEFYVGPTYRHMIDLGYKVGIYHIPNFQHHAVGTPDDLRQYIKDEKKKIKRNA